jgi:hypothetical protein
MAVSGATVYAFSIGRLTAAAIPTAETGPEGHYVFKRLDYGRYAVAPAKPAEGYPTPWYVPNCAHTKHPEIELSDENQSAKLDLRFGKKAGVLVQKDTFLARLRKAAVFSSCFTFPEPATYTTQY